MALVPAHANDEIFQLYSQKGTLIGSNSFSGTHLGAVVSVSYNNPDGSPQVVVAYRIENGRSVI